MKDDCDHELAVVPDVVALYSDDSATKQTELGSSNGSGSGVLAIRTSGGGGAAATRSNSPDEVCQVVRAAAELFVPALAAAYAARGSQASLVPPAVDASTAVNVARATGTARARCDSAAHAVPEGVRDLIRATAKFFASADAAGSVGAGRGDASSDSDFEAALLSTIDAEAFASDADAGAADEPDDSLAAAVLNHIGAVAVDDDADDVDGALYDGDPDAPALSQKVKPRVRTKRTRIRSKTIAMKRLTRAELQRGAVAHPPVEGVERPVTRSECAEGMRPCPWVACKHHLYLDINPRTGSIKINFPDLEPWELQHTCALDVADNGGLTLEEIGLITNLTRERVRQVEVRGLLTLRTRSNALR